MAIVNLADFSHRDTVTCLEQEPCPFQTSSPPNIPLPQTLVLSASRLLLLSGSKYGLSPKLTALLPALSPNPSSNT